jgi:hypothetical protein
MQALVALHGPGWQVSLAAQIAPTGQSAGWPQYTGGEHCAWQVATVDATSVAQGVPVMQVATQSNDEPSVAQSMPTCAHVEPVQVWRCAQAVSHGEAPPIPPEVEDDDVPVAPVPDDDEEVLLGAPDDDEEAALAPPVAEDEEAALVPPVPELVDDDVDDAPPMLDDDEVLVPPVPTDDEAALAPPDEDEDPGHWQAP